MGREVTSNDSLAKAIRSIHFDTTSMFETDEEIILYFNDIVWSYNKLKTTNRELETQVASQKDAISILKNSLVSVQGFIEFAQDMLNVYNDEVGYTDNLNEVFDYYTGKPKVSIKMSKEDFEIIQEQIYNNIKRSLINGLS